jgi:hypothetical protein
MGFTIQKWQWLLMGIIFWMLSPFLVYAQLLEPVSFNIEEDDLPQTVYEGTVFEITVTASIEEKWYLYSILNDPEAGPIPTTFASEGSEMIIAGDISESDAIIRYDPNFDAKLGHHSGSASFRIPVLFHSSGNDSNVIKLTVRFQACDDKSCLPPKTVTLNGGIHVEKRNGSASDIIMSGKDFGVGTGTRGYTDHNTDRIKNGIGLWPIIFIMMFTIIFTLAVIHYGRRR